MLEIDAATMRRLLIHEARVHAIPSREMRDLGDAILLYDVDDPEPFWNRLEAIRWPSDADAFDRRLAETMVLFASIGRQPHIWPAPAHDTPVDLVARLESNGFRDVGAGGVMVLADRHAAPAAALAAPPPGVTLERLSGLDGAARDAAAEAIAPVLVDAFEVAEERRPGVLRETVASLSHADFTHYIARVEGVPAAVARRATFDGMTYLSSIGTAAWARGRGLGGIVTNAAAADAVAAGGEWTYLGVFAENRVAVRVYERAGFRMLGQLLPDLLFIG